METIHTTLYKNKKHMTHKNLNELYGVSTFDEWGCPPPIINEYNIINDPFIHQYRDIILEHLDNSSEFSFLDKPSGIIFEDIDSPNIDTEMDMSSEVYCIQN